MGGDDGLPFYRYSCSLLGHSGDVRCVAAGVHAANSLLTGSRDGTVRVWLPTGGATVSGGESGGAPGYREVGRLLGHGRHYVGSVCALPPCDGHPAGLAASGNSSGAILLHDLASCTSSTSTGSSSEEVHMLEPVYRLGGSGASSGAALNDDGEGHQAAVSTLVAAKFGRLVSGSWDSTVRVWRGLSCQYTLTGHSGAVWAVATLPQSPSAAVAAAAAAGSDGTDEQLLLLTGAADRMIICWRGRQQLRVYRGHTDCVRALAVLTATAFVSCANDATVRRWDVTSGQCTAVLDGHTSFVYSIAVLPNGIDLVSGGEDRTVRVWRGAASLGSDQAAAAVEGGEEACRQTLCLPARSVWSVAAVECGDVAAACSDGVCRVFSAVAAREAAPDAAASYQREVEATQLAAASELGDLRPEQLAGVEALERPGRRDGQTLMVRQPGGAVTAHQWVSSQQQWQTVGQVVGASSKQLHTDGREYDHVFSVDVEEGAPPLKLPYNRADDPWQAAQQFIHRHQLPQQYLEQVANFIVTNTGKADQKQQKQQQHQLHSAGGVGNGNGMELVEETPHFPQTGLMYFDRVGNTAGMNGKLSENNSALGSDSSCRLDEQQLQQLVEQHASTAASNDKQLLLDSDQLRQLQLLMQWPTHLLLPVLDLLRLAVRSEAVCQQLCLLPPPGAPQCEGDVGGAVAQLVQRAVEPTAPPLCRMVALRLVCNAMRAPAGVSLACRHQEALVAAALAACQSPPVDRALQVAVATMLLNFAVVSSRSDAATETLSTSSSTSGGGGAGGGALLLHTVSALATCLQQLTDPEAQYRTLVGLGTVLSAATSSSSSSSGGGSWKQCRQLARSLDCCTLVSQLARPGSSSSDEPHCRVSACARQLHTLLQRL